MTNVKKRDINFLKASGVSKKMRMQASMGFLFGLVIVMIIVVLGGLLYSGLTKKAQLTKEVEKLDALLKEVERAETLNDFLAKKSNLNSLISQNKTSEKIRSVLENKFKIDMDSVLVFYECIPKLPQTENSPAFDREKMEITMVGDNITVVVNYNAHATISMTDMIIKYRENLRNAEAAGKIKNLQPFVVQENTSITITAKTNPLKEA